MTNSGPFLQPGGELERRAMRNYDNEKLSELEPLHALVDEILEKHRMLIPGGLYGSVRTWRDVLWEAIEDKSEKNAEAEETREEDGNPSDHYAETGYDRNAEPEP
jgi:hypothetical protein